MTVEAEIVLSELPSKVSPDEQIPWAVGVRTTGSGENYIGGGIFARPVQNGDEPVNGAIFILTDEQGNPVKVPPGESVTGEVSINPLNQWMSSIPDTLEWSAIVGWLEQTGENQFSLHATDRKDHTVSIEKEKPPTIWEQIIQWGKDNPEIVAASAVGSVAVVTYSATRD